MPKNKIATNKREPIQRTTRESVPWYRRVWFLLSLLGAGLYGLLTNGPTLLANAEKLPADFERVSSKFLVWHYDDHAWEGLWSASPEGYVDSVDMNLSAVDMKLHLLVEQGRVGDEIAMRSICRVTPMLDYYLLEGQVSGRTATITAFDFIGGKRFNFFVFTAEREETSGVITVGLKEGSPEWLPTTARIGRHPPVSGDDPYSHLTGTCRLEKEELLNTLRPSGLGRSK